MRQNGSLGWRPGPGKLGKKCENLPACDVTHRYPQTQDWIKRVSSQNWTTSQILRGFEHLSISSGWRVMAKNAPATRVAGAGTEGRMKKRICTTSQLSYKEIVT